MLYKKQNYSTGFYSAQNKQSGFTKIRAGKMLNVFRAWQTSEPSIISTLQRHTVPCYPEKKQKYKYNTAFYKKSNRQFNKRI